MVSRYADLLSEPDLNVLGRISGHGPGDHAATWFREQPMRIDAALDDDVTFARLSEADGLDTLESVTPLLVLAVVIHRGAAEIGEHTHLPERFGARLVIPVFDGERLARFTATPRTRLFLVELLGSYTRVQRGPIGNGAGASGDAAASVR